MSKIIEKNSLASGIRKDFSASIVVFFIALPLCLGIALASGAPLFAGIVSGIVGGIVAGSISKSPLGVSGPAAGLVTIVSGYLAVLSGSWEVFLLVVMLAGVIQLICGYLRLGVIAYYFPSSVINGMLVGIGLLIMIKQLPYLIGHEITLHFSQLLELEILANLNFPILSISAISIFILIIWDTKSLKNTKIAKIIQAPILVVALGIILFQFSSNSGLLHFSENQMVRIPVSNNMSEFFAQFMTPDFSQINNPAIYAMALVVALVASIETLLCVEATDKLDPQKRVTPVNQELKAQGVGNIVSGLLGGLPITQVIVRSSANISFGAVSKRSTIFHGALLLISAIAVPNILNMIPLVSLACILFVIGSKLAKIETFKTIYKSGSEQFIPFIITVLGMLVFDLLKGVGIGIICALGYIIYNNLKNSYHTIIDDEQEGLHIIKLAEDVSFLNKGAILQVLNKIPEESNVLIDGSNVKNIHHDVLEVIRDFKIHAKLMKISLEIKNIKL